MNEKQFGAINLWMADVGRVQPLVGLYPTDPVNCSRYVKCQRRNRAVSWNVGVFWFGGVCSWGSSTNAWNCAVHHQTSAVFTWLSSASVWLMSAWGFVFSLFFHQCFIFYGSFCVSWAYGATGGYFGLVYAWMLNGFFTFLNGVLECLSAGLQPLLSFPHWFWRSFHFPQSLDLRVQEVRLSFLGLLSFRWIFHCFWPVSIFGCPHTPKMLLGEWAERRDAALSHPKIKPFIIHAWRWFMWCQIARSF